MLTLAGRTRRQRVTAGCDVSPAIAGAPCVRLIVAGADEPGFELVENEAELRAVARELTDRALREGARHVSRSYRFPYALVAWHAAPVGVDIERVEPLEAAFIGSISTPGERARHERESAPDSYASSLWSSKEALAKALGDPVAYDPRRLGSPMYWRDGSAGPWRATELSVPVGHNGWLCWRAS